MTRLRPNPDPAHSLIASFSGVVDGLRQLQTNLGARPYRVFAVVVKWSGEEVGRGDPTVVNEVELLPTPLVRLRGIHFENKPAGKTDRGYLEVSEISPRYTEEQLLNSFHVKQDLEEKPESFELFYEVQRDARDGKPGIRRRFVLRRIADHNAEDFMWTIQLSAQDQRRGKGGKPAQVERVWRK